MKPIDLILDSGAYSAWKKQLDLSLDKYIAFAQRHAEAVTEVVNLDVIPGSWGFVPSPETVDKSANQSFVNAVRMRKEGLKVMPVFHMGERRYWLEKMIGDGFTYIGISPSNDKKTHEKIAWLDQIFGYLCGTKGFPTIKTHAFGATAMALLHRYPWYSADSLSWVLIAANGCVAVPRVDPETGKSIYHRNPLIISVSDQSRAMSRNVHKQKGTAERHYNNLGEEMRATADRWFHKNGFTYEELSKDHLPRMRLLIRFFYNSSMYNHCRPYQQMLTLFNRSDQGRTTPINDHFKFIFTANASRKISECLQAEKIQERLLSYYYWAFGNGFDLHKYVETGLIVPYPKKEKAKHATR